MIIRITKYLLLSFSFLFPWHLSAKKTPSLFIEEALSRLDTSLESYEHRMDTAIKNIDVLKVKLSEGNDVVLKMSLTRDIVGRYLHRNVDSAMVYSMHGENLAASVNDSDAILGFKIGVIPAMPLKGYIHETIELIDSLLDVPLSPEHKLSLFKAARLAYIKILSFYSAFKINEKYFGKFIAFNDSVLKYENSESRDYNLYLGGHYMGENRPGLAFEALSEYLDSVNPMTYDYLDATGLMALLSYKRGRYEEWVYRTILLAEYEAYQANADSENLRYLANEVYRYGDIKRAHRYMMLSHWLISKSGANQRGVHVARALPQIIESYTKEAARSYYAIWGILVCLALIGMLVLIIFKNKSGDLKKMKSLSEQLANANSVKEEYIGQFMSLCSNYIERLEDYNKLIARKLVAGQVEEACSMVKSQKFVESQVALFYEIFDKAFTHIYPTFIKDVNDLLVDDKTFKIGDGNKLTPELRILAFMRLGMDDSAQMARFLGLSLNTIYTYRNRMRSKARNRETFERDIAKIGSFSIK